MTGLYGWIGTFAQSETLDERLAHIKHALPPLGTLWEGRSGDATGLYAKTTSYDMTSFDRSGIWTTVVGKPSWKQEKLQALHKGQGSAVALAEAFRQYGTRCIEVMRGHYAVAVLDTSKKSALIAVDRMGTQPLFYALINGKGLVFASTAEALRHHPGLEVSVDLQALYNYIYFNIIPSPGTIYNHIYKLEPGQCLVYQDGKTDIKHYWQPTFIEDGNASFLNLKHELQQVLRKAIQRCNPDTTSGSFLSGGTDSSTVAGVLAEILGPGVPAYSIGFDEPGYDEVEYARIAAKHFGNQLREYYVTPEDVVAAIPEVARVYDEPFGNASAIPALFCARLASENGTHMLLAGDGGDELFAGNTRYATQKLFDVYHRVPPWLRRSLLEPIFIQSSISQNLPLFSKVGRYIEQAREPMPKRLQTYNFLHRISPSKVFSQDFLQAVDTTLPIDLMRDTYERAPCESLLNRMLYLDWKLTLADNDLRKVNRMCELAGVEVRYPLLDDELVEFSTRITPSLKLKGLSTRYFYKQALKDFLPHEIIKKSKHGFGLPFGIWLRKSTTLQELIYSDLTSLGERGIIQRNFMQDLLQSHRTDHAAYYGTLVWVLAMLERWLQEHNITI